MTSYSLKFKSDSTIAQIPTDEILQQIPNISEKINHFSPLVHQRIDLLLLGLEALNVGGTERILKISQQLGLKNIIKNRIFLWRLRCTNPLRRSYQRNYLTMEEVKALVVIIHYLAKLALSILNQLLLSSGSRGIERLWVSLWDGEVN